MLINLHISVVASFYSFVPCARASLPSLLAQLLPLVSSCSIPLVFVFYSFIPFVHYSLSSICCHDFVFLFLFTIFRFSRKIFYASLVYVNIPFAVLFPFLFATVSISYFSFFSASVLTFFTLTLLLYTEIDFTFASIPAL